MEKVTSGKFRVGTRQHFKLRFRIQPEWDSEVIHLARNPQIVSQLFNGIFEGGIEIWELKKAESGTEVTHTLAYQIKRWIYKGGWFLPGGEEKHGELTELALSRLKNLLESENTLQIAKFKIDGLVKSPNLSPLFQGLVSYWLC